jgi:hypothetical protein
LKNKLGEDVPLKFDLSYKDMQVSFQDYNADILFEYTLKLTISHDSLDPSAQG